MTKLDKPVFTGKQWESSVLHAPARLLQGSLLLTSGITARAADGNLVAPNDMYGQCLQVLSNLGDILQAAGTGAHSIIKISIFVTDIESFLTAKEVLAPLYSNRPVSTLVQVERLQVAEMMVEIELMAKLG